MPDDGNDTLIGNAGIDVLLAGAGLDVLDGGEEADYLDAGAGNEINVRGGAGDDVVRGGSGDDLVYGGDGIDQVYGDDGNDKVFGDAAPQLLGQRLFGGAGSDELFAFSITSGPNAILPAFNFAFSGEQMFGESGNDVLYGGLANFDVLVGGSGDDTIYGDGMTTNYVKFEGADAAIQGQSDLILGDDGEDRIFGGGGDDQIWGGADSDAIDGQGGLDNMFGGEGIDKFIMPTAPGVRVNDETFRGHYGNRRKGDVPDDNATDILVIRGTDADDKIILAQTVDPKPRLAVIANFGNDATGILANWINEANEPDIEQFQVSALGGSDIVGFGIKKADFGGQSTFDPFDITTNLSVQPLELRKLAERSRDWVTAFDGGSGNDMFLGSPGRDRFDGGLGSDILYGLGGDDRLWGDTGDGSPVDYDILLGGGGADDLVGGVGFNSLYAWSIAPSALLVPQFNQRDNNLANARSYGKLDATGGFGVFKNAQGSLSTRSFVVSEISSERNGTFGVRLSRKPAGDVVLKVERSNDKEVIVDKTILTFNAVNWDIPQNVVIKGTEDGIVDGDKISNVTVSVDGSASKDHSFDTLAPQVVSVITLDLNGPKTTPAPLSNTSFTLTMGNDPGIEDTGLNRMLGQDRDDYLFGGTALDFMYGQGGNDVLVRRDGTRFQSMDGASADDTWKEYAKSTNKVWYVSGSNANDEIHVDFVTEPGKLADHHLVTRLTENNGQFSFSAQSRLDFAASAATGGSVWDTNDRLINVVGELSKRAAGRPITDAEVMAALSQSKDTSRPLNEILGKDNDYLAIIVDALGGNDKITIGPTVQKSVWGDGGVGDDEIINRSGKAILVDKTEQGKVNGLTARNDTSAQAFDLGTIDGEKTFAKLTIDSPTDADWYKFQLGNVTLDKNARITVASINTADDRIRVEWFDPANLKQSNDATSLGSLTKLTKNKTYLLKVTSNLRPTVYDLQFDLDNKSTSVGSVANEAIALDALPTRRDLLMGGDGNDILSGGAGEDWIFGGNGADVLTGGLDRGASDLLFAGPGNDTFQIVPDYLPTIGPDPKTFFTGDPQTGILTASDVFNGGDGEDRVLFLGGDKDRRGFDVPDVAALKYNGILHRFEFSSLVWDIGSQAFVTVPGDSSRYLQQYLYYQTRNVENTQISLRSGDDVFHADPEFNVDKDRTADDNVKFKGNHGVGQGAYEQAAGSLAQLRIQGGNGNDALFGGWYDDVIEGGDGNDYLVGAFGNDTVDGGGGTDKLFGNEPKSSDTGASKYDDYLPWNGSRQPTVVGVSERYNFDLAAPFSEFVPPKMQGVALTKALGSPLVSDTTGWKASATTRNSLNDVNPLPAPATFTLDVNTSSSALLNNDEEIFNEAAALTVSGAGRGTRFYRSTFNVPDASSTAARIIMSSGNVAAIFINGVEIARDLDGKGSNSSDFPALTLRPNGLITDVQKFDKVTQFFEGLKTGTNEVIVAIQQAGNGSDVDSAFRFRLDLVPDLAQSFGAVGEVGGDQIQMVNPIGDFNNDGQPDFIAIGKSRSYVYFHPLDLDRVADIGAEADVIIDHASAGYPAQRMGDVNGDGISDIVLIRDNPSIGSVQVVTVFGRTSLGSSKVDIVNPLSQKRITVYTGIAHQWDSHFLAANKRALNQFATLDISTDIFSVKGLGAKDLNVNLAKFSDAGYSDIIVMQKFAQNGRLTVTDDIITGFIYRGGRNMPSSASHGFDSKFDILAEQSKYRAVLISEKAASGDLSIAVLPGRGTNGRDAILVNNFTATPTTVNDFATAPAEQAAYPLKYTYAGHVHLVTVHHASGQSSETFELILPRLNQPIENVAADLNRQFRSMKKVYGLYAEVVNEKIVLKSNGAKRITVTDQVTDAIRTVPEDNQNIGKADVDIAGMLGFTERIRNSAPSQIIQAPFPPVLNVKRVERFELLLEPYFETGFDFWGPEIAGLGNFKPEKSSPKFIGGSVDLATGDPVDQINALIASGNKVKQVGYEGTRLYTYFYDNLRSTLRITVGITASLDSSGRIQISINPTVEYVERNVQLGGFTGISKYLSEKLRIENFVLRTLRLDTSFRTIGFKIGPLGYWFDRENPVTNASFSDYNVGKQLIMADDSGKNLRIVLLDRGDVNVRGYPSDLGDIDGDGVRDYAIGRSNVMQVFHSGGGQDTNIEGPTGEFYTATTGDFNLDGKQDLVLRYKAKNASSARIGIFFDINGRRGAVKTSEADITLVGEAVNDNFGSLPTQPGLYVNNDLNPDLVVGASLADTLTGEIDNGKLYTFFSQFRGTPAISNLPELSTMSVPGSGSFLAETGVGVYEFKNDNAFYQLQNGNRDQWFRFTTLGDGLAENAIRVIPDLALGTLPKLKIDLMNTKGQLLRIGAGAMSLRAIPAGTYYLRVYTSDNTDAKFFLEATPPREGQTHETITKPDADRLVGGDGNDYLVGQDGRDSLEGDSGADTFIGENREIADADIGDILRTSVPGDVPLAQSIDNTKPTRDLDPVVDMVKQFPNVALRNAIYAVLGKRPSYHVRASELQSIAYLSPAGLGAGGIQGIELLTNLVFLGLNSGTIQSSPDRLSPIKPNRAADGINVGDEIGAKNLRLLDLRGSNLTLDDLQNLNKTKFEHLAVNVPGPSVTEAANEFEQWTNLNTLFYSSLTGNRISLERPGVPGPAKVITGNSFEIVRNVAPTVIMPATLSFNEGQVVTMANLLAGSTITDPADPLNTEITLLDPFGRTVDTRDLKGQGLGFINALSRATIVPDASMQGLFSLAFKVRLDKNPVATTNLVRITDEKGQDAFTVDYDPVKKQLNVALFLAAGATKARTKYQVSGGVSLQVGTEHDIVIRMAPSPTTGKTTPPTVLRVLMDGKQVGNTPQLSGAVYKYSSFQFGAEGLSMDDLRFYDASADAASDFAKNPTDSKAEHIWGFDESGGTTFKDLKGGVSGTFTKSVNRVPFGKVNGLVFVDDGEYTLTATTSDTDGAKATGTTKIIVSNVNPAVDLTTTANTAGSESELRFLANGNPLEFNATSDMYRSELSLSFDIKLDETHPLRVPIVLSGVVAGKPGPIFMVVIDNNNLIKVGFTNDKNAQEYASGIALTLGKKVHVTATLSGKTLSLYIDGVLVNILQATSSILTAGVTPDKLYFGGAAGGFLSSGGLTLDDVKLYARALTATEIADPTSIKGEMNAWLFNEKSGNQVVDSVGTVNSTLDPKTMIRQPILTTPGQIQFATGSNSLDIPAKDDMYSPKFSIAFYAQKDLATPVEIPLINLSNAYSLQISATNELTMAINGATGILSSGQLMPNNQRRLIVATFNGTLLSLYVDGVLAKTLTLPAGDYLKVPPTSKLFSIGKGGVTLDNVLVFNRALTANEVGADVGSVPGAIHAWLFDENSGTQVLDARGTMTGSLTSTMSRTRISSVGSRVSLRATPEATVSGRKVFDVGPIDNSKVRTTWGVTSNNGDVIDPAIGTTFNFVPKLSGRYVVTRTTYDPQVATDTDVSIVDVNPTIRGRNSSIGEGELFVEKFSVLASPTALARTFAWSVFPVSDLGVRSATQNSIASGNTGEISWMPPSNGRYEIVRKVIDTDSTGRQFVGTSISKVTVADVAPKLGFPQLVPGTAANSWQLLTPATTVSLEGMTITDPGSSNYLVTIDWGDKTNTTYNTKTPPADALKHTYAGVGNYKVSVSVTDTVKGVFLAKAGLVSESNPILRREAISKTANIDVKIAVGTPVIDFISSGTVGTNASTRLLGQTIDGQFDMIEVAGVSKNALATDFVARVELISPSGKKTVAKPVAFKAAASQLPLVAFAPTESGVWQVNVKLTGPGGTNVQSTTINVVNQNPAALTVTEGSVQQDSQLRTFTGTVSDFVGDNLTGTIVYQDLKTGTINEVPLPLTRDGNAVDRRQTWKYSISHVFKNASENAIYVRVVDQDGGTVVSPTKTILFQDTSNAINYPVAANGVLGSQLGPTKSSNGPAQPNAVPKSAPASTRRGGLVNLTGDEDGFTARNLQLGKTGTITLDVQGLGDTPANVDVWIDFNQDNSFDGPGEHVVDTQTVSTDGAKVFTIPVPANAVMGNTVARARISSLEDGDLTSTSFAAHGEVEDHVVSIEAMQLDIDTSGNLIVTSFGGRSDNITMSTSGANVKIALNDTSDVFLTQALVNAGATKDDATKTVTVPLAAITGKISVDSADGQDTLTITSGNGLPNVAINNDEGTLSDKVIINSATPVADVRFAALGVASSSATIRATSNGPASEIAFSGHVNLNSELNASQVSVDYSAADDQVTIVKGIDASHGAVLLSADASVSFLEPTDKLNVKADAIKVAEDLVIDAAITLDAANMTLESNLDTEGITLIGDVDLNSNVVFDSKSAIGDGRILIQGNIDGFYDLAVNSGAGETVFEGSVGDDVPLSKLATDLGTGKTRFMGGVVDADLQEYGDAIEVAGDITFDGDDIAFEGTVSSSAATPITIDVNADDEAVFEQSVTDGTSKLGIRNSGAGETHFQGVNTFSGDAVVAGGSLILDNTASLSSNVTLQAGEIGGSGVFGGKFTQLGGVLEFGIPTGILSIDDSVDLADVGDLVVQINGTVPGSGHDQLRIVGAGQTVKLSNANLVVTRGFDPVDSDQ